MKLKIKYARVIKERELEGLSCFEARVFKRCTYETKLFNDIPQTIKNTCYIVHFNETGNELIFATYGEAKKVVWGWQ